MTITANEIATAPREPVAIARAGYGHDVLPIGEPIPGAPPRLWLDVSNARWHVADVVTPYGVRVYYDGDGAYDGYLTVVSDDAGIVAVARYETLDDVMYEWEWERIR